MIEGLAKRVVTGAALLAPARVQSAAGNTANVHGSCEPACNDRADAQDGD